MTLQLWNTNNINYDIYNMNYDIYDVVGLVFISLGCIWPMLNKDFIFVLLLYWLVNSNYWKGVSSSIKKTSQLDKKSNLHSIDFAYKLSC